MEALAQSDNVRDDATVSQFIPLLARCGNLFGFVGKGHRWFAIFANVVLEVFRRARDRRGVGRDVDDNQPVWRCPRRVAAPPCRPWSGRIDGHDRCSRWQKIHSHPSPWRMLQHRIMRESASRGALSSTRVARESMMRVV